MGVGSNGVPCWVFWRYLGRADRHRKVPWRPQREVIGKTIRPAKGACMQLAFEVLARSTPLLYLVD